MDGITTDSVDMDSPRKVSIAVPSAIYREPRVWRSCCLHVDKSMCMYATQISLIVGVMTFCIVQLLRKVRYTNSSSSRTVPQVCNVSQTELPIYYRYSWAKTATDFDRTTTADILSEEHVYAKRKTMHSSNNCFERALYWENNDLVTSDGPRIHV